MSGTDGVYTARRPDFIFYYSELDRRCVASIFLPGGIPVGVYGWMRGGGLISQSSEFDLAYDPDANVGEGGDFLEAILLAGFAYVRIEYPSGPTTALTSRHHPFWRFPHNWMNALECFKYMQTHALDGKCTGSRSITLPQTASGYIAAGVSAGAAMAAFLATMPLGHSPFNADFRRDFGYHRYWFDGRVRGCVFDGLPAHFGIYDESISSAELPFFAVSERLYTDPFADIPRGNTIPKEIKLADSFYTLIRRDAEENRHVGFLFNAGGNIQEASYLRSGLTIKINGAYTGTLANAATVETSDPTKGGEVKLQQQALGIDHIYLEPNAATNSGFPDTNVTNDWTGALTVKDGAGSTIATIPANAGPGEVDSYEISGNDTRKTFLSRQAAVKIVKDTATDADGFDFASFPELTTPHPNVSDALVKDARDEIWGQRGIESLDAWFSGNPHSAAISGDQPSFTYNVNTTKHAQVLLWAKNKLGFVTRGS